MNNHKPTKKTYTYIFIGLLVLLAVIFYFYQSGKGDSSSTTLTETNVSDQAVGARILSLLNQISSLKIDAALFTQPTYMTLKDYTVEISPLPVGRVNPFAPIPGMPAASGSSAAGR
jgi:hypothetical protein